MLLLGCRVDRGAMGAMNKDDSTHELLEISAVVLG